ncbi:MAG TPA: NAD(P)/FAD-dependent oxidoreductase [Nocardioides sp.]|uniref:NAD(P)/FAD-dependent oxidoreductase n=1 Tax=Nocardioides sp. TaxID=35761 RepID=UPI002B7E9FEA|nr:NAD(P)/FAD-dependent oxidoreductase [Nocardioides sp.]HTW15983.1 NAD(P)/FAD-dependent oxidoreductase [Nocardioides sp.]
MTDAPVADTDVVVLGGGLAGVACALRLGDEGVRVSLVDRNDYHQFQPLLYQVATSQLPAEDVARPHRSIFRAHPTVELRSGEATRVDPPTRSVLLAGGDVVRGTHLVIAAGGRAEFFGVPGAAEHAYPLYSVEDAERLRLHLQDLLAPDGAGQRPEDALDVVVVGGGPTGVEVAGALAELADALVQLGELPRRGRIVLVDRGATLLGAFSEKSHAYALHRLTKQGAEVRLGTGVAAVHPDRVELDDGSVLPTRTVVWGGGESAAGVVAGVDLPSGRGGRVDVGPDLAVVGHPQVYAVGDVANIPAAVDPGVLPQLGSVAQQSGRWAAENILRDRAGQPTRPFHYKDKGIMAMIGRNAAVAEVGRHRHQVDGPVAFAAWLGVHAMLLSGSHSRTDAFLSWAWDYFDRDHAAVVESSTTPRRIAWGDDEADLPTIAVGRTPAAPAGSA